MENTKATAYAFMIMLAGLAVLAHYGRASAQMSAVAYAPNAATSAPAGYGGGMMPGPQPQYGLVQTGVMGVSRLDAGGTFGAPSVMPVFQIIQLQAPAGTPAPGNVGMDGTTRPMMNAPDQAAAASVPQGITVSPPASAQMIGTPCDINGIRVVTQSPSACGSAGGQVPTL